MEVNFSALAEPTGRAGVRDYKERRAIFRIRSVKVETKGSGAGGRGERGTVAGLLLDNNQLLMEGIFRQSAYLLAGRETSLEYFSSVVSDLELKLRTRVRAFSKTCTGFVHQCCVNGHPNSNGSFFFVCA